jgi:thiamine-phosphate pyrophosphorylase
VCARAGWTIRDLAAACLDGGARVLQVRAKHADAAWLLETAVAVAAEARRGGARVIVNDRADIAAIAGADGVHVGQEDLRPEAVRRVVGPDAVIGLSTHTQAQLDAAAGEPADYLAVGPVYATGTKASDDQAIGLAGVHGGAAAARRQRRPLVAIGGITLASAPAVIAAGADAVAVISDLLTGGDPSARVRAFVAALA